MSGGELRRDRADEAVAGAGGIDRVDATACDDQRFAVDQRQHAAFARVTQMIWSRLVCNDLAAAMNRSSPSAVVKLGPGQQAELGFIENQDIDEIEQTRGRI